MMVYQPAEAYLMGGIACKSDMPRVTTPDTRWISTPCYPVCFFDSSVGRDNATAFVIHFDHSYKSDKQGCTKTESEDCKEVVKLTGPIRVAVRSNDSRIDPPYLREINLGSSRDRIDLPIGGFLSLVFYQTITTRHDLQSWPFKIWHKLTYSPQVLSNE